MRMLWSAPFSKASDLFPDPPGRRSGLPKLLQQNLVPDGVHALPEAVVAVGHQLAVARQVLQRLLLELGAVALYVVEDLRLADEEGAVDPPFAGLRLFVEHCDRVATHLQVPEPRRR